MAYRQTELAKVAQRTDNKEVMATTSTGGLAGILMRTGFFSESQLNGLLEKKRASEQSITELVVDGGYAKEGKFLVELGKALGVPFSQLGAATIESEVLDKLPPKAVFQYNVIPVSVNNGTLLVATNDPFDPELIDALRLASGMRVRIALSTSDEIAKAAKKFYGVGAETVASMMEDDRYEVDAEVLPGKVDLDELDQEASIVKFVNQIIWEACRQRATDIHFEPMENELRIRYRIDGVLHQTPLPPKLKRFQAAILSRIKVMANMDIAEKRLPADGRIGLRIESEDVDIRVSTMPTVYGESISLRLLQRKGRLMGLEELGMYPKDVEIVRKVIHRPNGIVLVTGPTGSGKSTSLYAYLQELNSINCRILTVEDPIEYEIEGINQVLVRPDIGLSFARALRSFLRQDPDIIMVGEIRDFETAEIAIQASLTGHLVFSTLHTNDAAGAFTRLLDMGVEPYLVASSVEGVVAQRLVRRLCVDCKKKGESTEVFLKSIGFPVERLGDKVIYEEVGCDKCRMTGFQGRTGIYEVLKVDEVIQSHVIARQSTNAIMQTATRDGMRTLRDDGWEKVLSGVTTVNEILRVSEENE